MYLSNAWRTYGNARNVKLYTIPCRQYTNLLIFYFNLDLNTATAYIYNIDLIF